MANINARRHASTEEAQASYLARVDALVESMRALPAAKADAYRAKYEDACGIMNGKPSSGWVADEAAALSKSEVEVAEAIISARSGFEAEQSAIEASRVAAKAKIRQCQSPKKMHEIVESIRRLA